MFLPCYMHFHSAFAVYCLEWSLELLLSSKHETDYYVHINYKVVFQCSNIPMLYIQLFFKATIYHSILQQVRQHHHNPTLSVVNKLPHVPSGGLHGTLSYDVRLLLLITLQKADEYSRLCFVRI